MLNCLQKMAVLWMKCCGFAEATDHDGDDSMGSGTADMMKAMFTGTPLHSILSFSSEELTYEDIQDTIRKLNEAEKNNNY